MPEERLQKLEESVDKKLDKELFWRVFLFSVGLTIAAISHLYVIYYGGIANLGTGIAVIEAEIKHINSDIKEIKFELNNADIYAEED